VTLKHRWSVAIELVFKSARNARMVVPDVVNAVAGIEIQNAPTVIGEELRSDADRVVHIHPEHVEQPHPLRIDVSFVSWLARGGEFCL
jgi:hypothetical protein